MSTKHKPLELANALIAKEAAYANYDAQPTNEFKAEAWKAVIIIEERYSQLYAEWQSLGGTSDIDTLVLNRLDGLFGHITRRVNSNINGNVRYDPRTTAQVEYDFTPIPSDMPIIDMNTIEEIEL